MRMTTFPTRVLLAALAFILAAPPVSAQYFGSNKVRYKTFDFEVLKTERFDIHHYPEERQAVEEAARMAERWNTRLSKVLRHTLSSRQPLILYASHPHFEQTNAIQGQIGESTGGVTEALRRRVVMPFASGLGDTNHVLGHELVHAFQFDMAAMTQTRGLHLPLWFVEGMAEYLSIGPEDPHTAMWLRDALLHEKLPRIDQLDDPDYFPYRFGHAFWAYIAGRFGDEAVGNIYVSAARNDAITALETITGIDHKTLSTEWHAAIARTYGEVLRARRDGHQGLRTVIRADDDAEVNISPAVSPDGTRLVFLSSRDLFSIDLFLADASDGRIIRKLSETATDPHLDALQFVTGSGTWHPTEPRFAYTMIRSGKPTITIVNTENGDRERRVSFDEVDEIFNLAWSPDGRTIALSGMSGGMSDLYLLDVETMKLRRLTEDLFLDLQPAWSPDGRRLVFISDRFTSDLSRGVYGEPRLVFIDVDSGTAQPVDTFETGRQINPQWDRRNRITFIADPDGIADVYRFDVASGKTQRLTALPTGASGITPLSPALSVATGTGQAFFTTFVDGRYSIMALPADAEGVRDGEMLTRHNVIGLPPLVREQAIVTELLQNPGVGLPPPNAPTETVDYRPRLGLEYAGQPYIGVGADRFGGYAGGGVGFLFSDLLGDHTVLASAQIQGGWKDFGGQLGYINRSRRIGWGGLVEQIPYVTGSFRQGVGVEDGRPVFVDEVIELRQTHRQAIGLVEYPLSRAQRLEFSGGIRSIGFEATSFSRIFDLDTGEFLGEREERLPEFGSSLNLGEFSAALVYDTSIAGPVGPLLGRRYRLEVAPTFGDLRLSSVLGDYREYWMPFRPFTVAGRVLFFGRYGGDAEDTRLSPLFVGYPTLVRGYDFDSFDIQDCSVTADGRCPEFDQLLGSRMLVGNLELRFPLYGLFTGRLEYGPLPVEGMLFTDVGVAWTRDEKPSFANGTRDLVRSVGAGVRVNAFGFAVLEFAGVRPLDRPARNWMFIFNLQPAF